MRGILLKDFFECRANEWPRKRRKSFPLQPQLKRPKLTIFSQQAIAEDDDDDDSSAEDEEELSEFLVKPIDHVVDVPCALQGKEKSRFYPSVVYEGNVATVKLGVGQMVVLDGCAMVQVVEGQASMLGYSFPRGTDVLVCSSSKLAEIITIEAQHGGAELMDIDMAEGREETKDVLGCQLKFASHTLGQNILSSVVPGRNLSFKLEFVAPLGSSLGKKRGRKFLDEEIQDQDSRGVNELDSEDDELCLDSEADSDEVLMEDVEPAGTPEIAKRHKGRGYYTSNAKKQKDLPLCTCCLTSRHFLLVIRSDTITTTNLSCDWKEAVEFITLGSSVPVIAICGAKNVGKSTFARFQVNSLLNRYKEVAYLQTSDNQNSQLLRVSRYTFLTAQLLVRQQCIFGHQRGIGYDVIDILNSTSPTKCWPTQRRRICRTTSSGMK